MRIAVVTSSAPFGMGESFVVTEVNSLIDAGINVYMAPTILRTGDKNKLELNLQVKLLVSRLLAFRVIKVLVKTVLKNPFSIARVLWALRSWSVLTLAKNLAVFPKGVWLADEIKREEIDHLHAHWLSTPSTVAMVASMLSGVPWSCTAHRGDIVANNLLCRKIHSAKFIRFISKSGIELARKRCADVETKARVLHMGVSIPDVLKLKCAENLFVVLCPANMIGVKGHRYLIEAWGSIKTDRPHKLLLAGDGDLRRELEGLVKSMGLGQSIEFLGQLRHSDLLEMYIKGKVDLVVLPSVDLGNGLHEGIPVGLMEAMACGIPVISTNTGGISELLSGGAGVMVAPADSNELSLSISKFMNSEEITIIYRKKGRAKVVENFNNKKVADTLVNWFS